MIIGAVPILIDARKMRRSKITCRCEQSWSESVPAEVHDSWLTMCFFCPQCGTEYHLQNKKLERAVTRSGTLPKADSWPVPGNRGNA